MTQKKNKWLSILLKLFQQGFEKFGHLKWVLRFFFFIYFESRETNKLLKNLIFYEVPTVEKKVFSFLFQASTQAKRAQYHFALITYIFLPILSLYSNSKSPNLPCKGHLSHSAWKPTKLHFQKLKQSWKISYSSL